MGAASASLLDLSSSMPSAARNSTHAAQCSQTHLMSILQAGSRRSPAQEASSTAERHRQLHLTTATRSQHGHSARRMLRQKYAAPGLVQRMHRMQAEVAEPMKPWEIAKAGQEVSLNQSKIASHAH